MSGCAVGVWWRNFCTLEAFARKSIGLIIMSLLGARKWETKPAMSPIINSSLANNSVFGDKITSLYWEINFYSFERFLLHRSSICLRLWPVSAAVYVGEIKVERVISILLMFYTFATDWNIHNSLPVYYAVALSLTHVASAKNYQSDISNHLHSNGSKMMEMFHAWRVISDHSGVDE